VTESTRGRLLVATPPLVDPNFDRTVVLMLAHNPDGAVGVVINRPTDTEVGAVLPQYSAQVAPPSQVFEGGPVEPGVILGLGLHVAPPPATEGAVDPVDVDHWNPVIGALGTVDLTRDPDQLRDLRALRLFAGYAGWGAGQLENELAARAWLVVELDEADVFTANPDELWRVVLARQSSPMAWLANYPDDVISN
jgi:putative transcriptional regulator